MAPPPWTRYIIRRDSRPRTTWTFRVVVVALAFAAGWATRAWWSPALARDLVCDEDRSRSDALLLENFDADYLVFERAAMLQRVRVARRVFVPLQVSDGRTEPYAVNVGIATLMADIAKLERVETIRIAGRRTLNMRPPASLFR